MATPALEEYSALFPNGHTAYCGCENPATVFGQLKVPLLLCVTPLEQYIALFSRTITSTLSREISCWLFSSLHSHFPVSSCFSWDITTIEFNTPLFSETVSEIRSNFAARLCCDSVVEDMRLFVALKTGLLSWNQTNLVSFEPMETEQFMGSSSSSKTICRVDGKILNTG